MPDPNNNSLMPHDDPQLNGIIDRYRLKTIHAKAILLRFSEIPYPEIAKRLSVHPGTPANWFKANGLLHDAYSEYSQLILKAKSLEQLPIAEDLSQHAPKSLQNIKSLERNAKSEDVRLRSSQDILNRAGYAPVTKVANVHYIDELTDDQLLKEAEALAGRKFDIDTNIVEGDEQPRDKALDNSSTQFEDKSNSNETKSQPE